MPNHSAATSSQSRRIAARARYTSLPVCSPARWTMAATAGSRSAGCAAANAPNAAWRSATSALP